MRITRRIVILLAPLLIQLLASGLVAHCQTGVTLTGKIADDSGTTIANASVRLYSAKGLREIKADIHGAFEFTYVEIGNYELEVTSPGFKRVAKVIEIKDKTPELIEIRLRIEGGGHCAVRARGAGEKLFNPGLDISYEKQRDKIDVRGLVRDDLGSVLVGVRVKLEMGGTFRTAVSNEKGEFVFTGVEPGRYILASSQGGFWDISRYLWIIQGDLSNVTVTIPDKRRVPCFEDSGAN